MLLMIYQFVAFIFLGWIYIRNDDDSNLEKYKGIFLAAIWPITIILMLCVLAVEGYRDFYRRRIHQFMAYYGVTNVNRCVARLNLKQLKLLLWAKKVGAYTIDDKGMDLVQQRLSALLFEKDVLGVKDGETKS